MCLFRYYVWLRFWKEKRDLAVLEIRMLQRIAERKEKERGPSVEGSHTSLNLIKILNELLEQTSSALRFINTKKTMQSIYIITIN